jgi:hypothetical protein
MKTYRGTRGIAPLILDHGTKWTWIINFTPRSLYPRKNPGTHLIRGWVGPRAGMGFWRRETFLAFLRAIGFRMVQHKKRRTKQSETLRRIKRGIDYWWRKQGSIQNLLQFPASPTETQHETHKAHGRINLTLRRLMSYIYEAPILDVSRSHTTTQHSR